MKKRENNTNERTEKEEIDWTDEDLQDPDSPDDVFEFAWSDESR